MRPARSQAHPARWRRASIVTASPTRCSTSTSSPAAIPSRQRRRSSPSARLFRRLRPDVVQSHLFQSIITTRLAAWLADVPVRFSMIPGPYYLEAPGLREVDTRTAGLDTKVIASCERTRELYEAQGVPRDRVELIYYGQDVHRLDPARGRWRTRAAGTGHRSGAAGRRRRRLLLSAADRRSVHAAAPGGPGRKGHEVLLRAVPLVLAEVPDALFLLVGEGWGPDGAAYQRQLEALAADLGVAHAVRFTGARHDIPDTLAAFDVSVQCSLNENLGGSLESLLMERPFIATAVGGLVDAVIHERTGLLVPPDDAPALARAIVRLLRDRAARATPRVAGPRIRARDVHPGQGDGPARRPLHARASFRRPRLPAVAIGVAGVVSRCVGLAALRAVEADRRGAWARETARRDSAARAGAARAAADARANDTRRPSPGAPPAGGPRAPRIVQMAGIVENGDWLVSICRDLRAKGGDVTAIIGAPEGTVARRLREAGVPYQSLPLSFASGRGQIGRLLVYAARLPWTVVRLARFFRRERVDVVHTHVFNTIMIGRLAAWLARVPCRVSMITGPLHLEAPIHAVGRQHDVVDGPSGRSPARSGRATAIARSACASAVSPASPTARTPGSFDPGACRRGTRAARAGDRRRDVPLIGVVAYFYPPTRRLADAAGDPRTRRQGSRGFHRRGAADSDSGRRTRAFVLAGAGWGAAGERYRQHLIARCREEHLDDAVIVPRPPRRRAGDSRRARRRGAVFAERELRRHDRGAADGAADRGHARGRHAGNDPSRRDRPARAAARSRGAGRGDPASCSTTRGRAGRWRAPAAR